MSPIQAWARFYHFYYFINLVYLLPVTLETRGGLGILDLTDSNDIPIRQRFEEVTRLDCASQRNKALNRKKNGDAKIYVPICSAANPLQYAKMQCHDVSLYCWCVDEMSGEPKIGSSTHRGKPTCQETSTAPPKKKRKNRCKANRRTRFLRRLVNSIKADMIMSGVNATTVKRDSALQWKFNQLNKNKNQYLERSEWKPYKAELLEWKNARHCSRNFFKTCDMDRDRKLTFDEWKKCIVKEVNMVPAKRPDQLNPFLYILKPE